MKDKLTEDAFTLLFDKLIHGVGDAEFEKLLEAIQHMTLEKRDAITTAAIGSATAQAEAAFIAGLRLGRDPLLLVLKLSAKRHKPGRREKRD